MPNKILAGENNIKQARIDDIRISEMLVCKKISKKSLMKSVSPIETADKKIITASRLAFAFLSAILPPR